MKKVLFSFALFFLLLGCKKEVDVSTSSVDTKVSKEIQVIQFHSENRCMTCNKIEALTLETLETYPELTFSLVNIDEPKNEAKAEEFEVTGTALFLFNLTTKAKLDLTEFAFMTAGDEAKFKKELKNEIDKFLKS